MGILDDFYNSDSTTDLYGGHIGSIDHHTSASGIHNSDLYGDHGQYIGNIEVCGDKVYRYNSEGRIVGSGTYYPEADRLDMMNENGSTEIYDSTNIEKFTMFDKDGDSIYNPCEYKSDGYTKNNDVGFSGGYSFSDLINDLNGTGEMSPVDEYLYNREHRDSPVEQFLEHYNREFSIDSWNDDNNDDDDNGWGFW